MGINYLLCEPNTWHTLSGDVFMSLSIIMVARFVQLMEIASNNRDNILRSLGPSCLRAN